MSNELGAGGPSCGIERCHSRKGWRWRTVPILIITSILTLTETAGERDKPSYIVGGADAGSEFDFVVEVHTPVSSCTGTLVHERWVLTAAHCIPKDQLAEDIEVCHQESGCRSSHWRCWSATDVEFRPTWDGLDEGETLSRSQSQYDQALVRLRRPIRSVDPAPLTSRIPSRVVGIVLGWGRTQWTFNSDEDTWEWSDTLQKLPVNVKKYHPFYSLLSARNPTSGSDGVTQSYIAPGDSGGPVMIWTLGGWTAVGVGSLVELASDGKSITGYYAMTTSSFMRWFQSVLENYEDGEIDEGEEIPKRSPRRR